MYKVSETVLPIYINGQCPIIKTCSDVTLNLSSKDSNPGNGWFIQVYVPLMKNSKILLLCIFETSEQLNIGVKEIKQLNSGWPD